MGLKRFIFNMVLKISRAKQKYGTSIYNTRTNYARFAKIVYWLNRTPKDVKVEMSKTNGLTLTPLNKNQRIIMYLHGGGFVLGLQHLKNLCIPFGAQLAKVTNSVVWFPEYRVAPEHSYPIPLDDCLASYLSLIKNGARPEDITVIGSGSGGALALALVMKLRDKKLPMPGSVATVSVWADLCLTAESIRTRSDRDPFLTAEVTLGYFNYYMQGARPNHPYVSPFYGDYKNFPPLYMIVGGCEIFYDDTTRIAQKAKEAGVDVTLDIRENMFHGYPVYFDIYEEGLHAIHRLATFLTDKAAEAEATNDQKKNLA